MASDGRRWQMTRPLLALAMACALAASADGSQHGAAKRRPGSGARTAGAQRVAAVCAEWAGAWGAKDLERLVGLYADDAVFLPATGGRITGRAAIKELFRQALETNSSRLQIRSIRTHVEGGLAFDSGEYEERKSGDSTRPGRGQYLVVCRRDATGTWRIIEHVWTDTPTGTN